MRKRQRAREKESGKITLRKQFCLASSEKNWDY
jgi:hypothetical protein